ncbi:MAG: bis(5'-nucleosyl)-tetraphosphatase (symmetrical), partial [Phenylobacterium sp.]
LSAPDADELIHWLTQQPLLLTTGNVVMSHAGISPQWTIPQAIELAKEVEAVLQSERCDDYLRNMYHTKPTQWSEHLEGFARFRYIVNSLTRMRFCLANGELEFDHKDAPVEQQGQSGQSGLVPWFDLAPDSWSDYRLIFGHWASLMGETGHKHIIGLDTGCVWGNHMTMLQLQENQDAGKITKDPVILTTTAAIRQTEL